MMYNIKTGHRYLYLRKLYYYAPQSQYANIQLTAKAEKWMIELEKNGVVKIENEFNDLVEYINKEYFSGKNSPYIAKDINTQRSIEMGIMQATTLSLKDPRLEKLYFNDEMLAMLSKHYKRQAYYRNLPTTLTNSYDQSKHKKDMQALFHLDGGLDQISFMFLVNDLTDNDTHLQFSLGSNREKHKTADRYKFNQEEIEKNYPLIKCTGKAGTLFIFQAGLGFHRGFQVSGSTRKILHANFTSGHDLVPQQFDKKSDFKHIENKAFYVKKSIDKIVTQ
ncbi:MAG: hypothetical protein ACKOXB_03570 [Flavobacteriales bacterium]